MLLDAYRTTVRPEHVDRLLALQPQAVAELRAACPGLVRYECARLDATTWLDLIVWADADAAAAAAAVLPTLPAAMALHALVAGSEPVGRGTLEVVVAAAS